MFCTCIYIYVQLLPRQCLQQQDSETSTRATEVFCRGLSLSVSVTNTGQWEIYTYVLFPGKSCHGMDPLKYNILSIH